MSTNRINNVVMDDNGGRISFDTMQGRARSRRLVWGIAARCLITLLLAYWGTGISQAALSGQAGRRRHAPGRASKTKPVYRNSAVLRTSLRDIKVAPDGKVYACGHSMDYGDFVLRCDSANPEVTFVPIESCKEIAFSGDGTIWVIGGTEKDKIYKSTDGNRSWRISFDNPDRANLQDLFFLDSLHGWVSAAYFLHGDELISAINRKLLEPTYFYTEDGGSTWKKGTVGKQGDWLGRIQFVDINNGWATGGRNYVPGYWEEESYLFKTTDGGRHWKAIDIKGVIIQDFHFINAMEGWAILMRKMPGNILEILHTTDGGETWETQHREAQELFRRITFVNSLEGWAVGSCILRTEDGGVTWDYFQAPGSGFRSGFGDKNVIFLNRNTGWTHTFSDILTTTDGGKNWTVLPEQWKEKTRKKETAPSVKPR